MATKGIPIERVCIDCGNKFIGYGCRRCEYCQRDHASQTMARSRARRRAKEINDGMDPGDGWQFCAKCKCKRHISEFRTRFSGGRGKRNKICDRCLTRIYAKREYHNINENFWRTKAYNCNTCGRQRLARIRGVSVSKVPLLDLEWVCKPQDLIKLFNDQNGKCAYCGVDLEPGLVWIDHKIPLSRDGHHVLSNICFACKDCNVLKGTRTDTELLEFIQEYTSRFATTSRRQDKEPADNTFDAIHGQ